MTALIPRRLLHPASLVAVLTGLILGGLLVGFEPVGGDPDRLYRPLKLVLARFLASGTLPFWSDRFGLGIPLLAESHVAAFYPLNWFLYRLFSVSTAYRLGMWTHHVALALMTYTYARYLQVSPRGAMISALAFVFCGFQAIHSTHEPFYLALPYLVAILLAGEWYVREGRRSGVLLLAVLWGCQLTLGHFQLQFWTAALVVAIGTWRIVADGRPWSRLAGLVLALCWGAALASVQLAASWELARFVGFTRRPFAELAFFAFPPSHWAELAIPAMVRGIPGGGEAPYWYAQGTSGFEACFYIGTLPLLLALVAVAAGRRGGRLAPWGWIIAVTVLLAMLPRAWPQAYAWLLEVPGLGWFRAPGRYVLISSLGLSLFAGAGLDRAAEPVPIRRGMALAWTCALAAMAWTAYWSLRPEHQRILGGTRLLLVIAMAAFCWVGASVLLLAWRRGRIGFWLLLLATAAELGVLYYTSTTVWGWAVHLPEESAVLARLAAEPDGARVAGLVHNLPVFAGATPLFPYTGLAAPPPHPELELATRRSDAFSAAGAARLARYGTTHGIWDGPVDPSKAEILLESEDSVLDRVVYKPPGAPAHPRWRLVRYADPFPTARAAIRVRTAPSERALVSGVSFDQDRQAVWYRAGDQPPPAPGPLATTASVLSWDGRTAVVEHDGTCDLVIHRTYYPGWMASVNGLAERPVARAELGVQSVRLEGRGPSRVDFVYRPTGLRVSSAIALAAGAMIFLFAGFEAFLLARRRASRR